MRIDKWVIFFIIFAVIAVVLNVIYTKAVLSSDLPWWMKYFFIFRL